MIVLNITGAYLSVKQHSLGVRPRSTVLSVGNGSSTNDHTGECDFWPT
jgi:hypothetical protein